jgi:ABC-type sugar transport system, permease component
MAARTRGRRASAFDIVNYALMGALALVTIYPFWSQLVVSFSTEKAFYADAFHILPTSFSLKTYAYALSDPAIVRATLISAIVTACGTALSMAVTSMGAYALSKPQLAGRKLIFTLIVITIFFSGGTIPWFILVNLLGMKNTLFAFFVPNAINTFNLIMMKNFFTATPPSLEESAKIEGYDDFRIFLKIVLPISMPIVATISLFYAVYFWNDFYTPMLFVSTNKLYPLALVLRNMVLGGYNYMAKSVDVQQPEMVRSAVIVISILPIMMAYPFIQKYFVKGVMLGSIKE